VSRLRRIETYDRIFFVTTNVLSDVRPFDDSERDIVLRILSMTRDKHGATLAGYAVMPDHIHLLLMPGEKGLPMFMHGLKRTSQLAVSQSRKRNIPLWQRKYFDHIIRTVRDYWEKLEYIHNNPVAAALTASPNDWRWSSHGAYAGSHAPAIAVNKMSLPADADRLLWPPNWKRAGE
jgi:putative transposase